MLKRRSSSSNDLLVAKLGRSQSVSKLVSFNETPSAILQQDPSEFFKKKKYTNMNFNPNRMEINAMKRAALEKSNSSRKTGLTPLRSTFQTSKIIASSRDSSPVVSLRESFNILQSPDLRNDISTYRAMQKPKQKFFLDLKYEEYRNMKRGEGKFITRKTANQVLDEASPKKSNRTPNRSLSRKTIIDYEVPLPSLRKVVEEPIKKIYRTVIRSQHAEEKNVEAIKHYNTAKLDPKLIQPVNFFKRDPKPVDDSEKVAENAYSNAVDGFMKRMQVYNNCYAEHLVSPQMELLSKKFLGVKSGALGAETAREIGERADMLTKLTIMDRLANRSRGRTRSVEVESDKMPKKSLTTRESRAKENESIFRNSMERMEEVSTLLKNQGPELTLEQQEFLKLVKEGRVVSVMQILNEDKSFVHIRDSTNQTPLHWAVKRKYDRIITLLLRNGADFLAVDLAGRKPKDIAKKAGNRDIINILESFEKGYYYYKSQGSQEVC